VTVVLMTYRHERYIGEALSSYLAQEGDPIEILVCDDHSPDATVERAREVIDQYAGPHEARVIEQDRNIGGFRNFLSGLEVAKGELIVVAHSDDVAVRDRVARLREAAERTGASLIASDAWVYVDGVDERRLIGPERGDRWASAAELSERSFDTRFLGATFCYRRHLFEGFPDLREGGLARFNPGDHFLPYRATLLGGVWYVDAPLIHWRQHPGQVTRRVIQTEGGDDDLLRLAGKETVHCFGLRGVLRRLHDIAHAEAEHGLSDAGARRGATARLLIKKVGLWSQVREALESKDQRLHLRSYDEVGS
jgi:glycosyltransferase involved in cell wall biosynthesis